MTRLPGSTSLYGVSSGNVPSGPAGAGSVTEEPPGTDFPATPLTDWVENANVSCANATRSLLTVERVVVVVRERVARLVVAGVELHARSTAPDRLLLRRLDLLRAGEEATGRDAVLDERLIVAAAVERRVV